MTSRPRKLFDFLLLYTLFVVVRPLPQSWLLALGRGLGTFTWRVVHYRRAIVLDNLRHAFGHEYDEDQLAELAHTFFKNLGMTLMEFLAFPRFRRQDFLEMVEVEGSRYLHQAVSEGRGCLFITGHFGNWELMAARVAAAGFKVTVAVKTQSNAHVDRIQNEIRQKVGIGILRTDSGVRAMLKALRQGRMLAMVADQDAGADGFFTEFLGRPASFFKGPALFAYRARVPLLTVFIYRLADGRHRVVIEPPAKLDPQWDEDTAVAHLTQHHARRLEAAIRRSPANYFWVHRRWKTKPPVTSNN